MEKNYHILKWGTVEIFNYPPRYNKVPDWAVGIVSSVSNLIKRVSFRVLRFGFFVLKKIIREVKTNPNE